MLCLTIVVCLIGIGLTIAFVAMINPGYNFNTGCPYNMTDCSDQIKMRCYAKSILTCILYAPLGTGLFVAVVIVVILIVKWKTGDC